MRLILDSVTVDHHAVHLDGPPVILGKLTQTSPSKSLPEVLSFAQEWRARKESNLPGDATEPEGLKTLPSAEARSRKSTRS